MLYYFKNKIGFDAFHSGVTIVPKECEGYIASGGLIVVRNDPKSSLLSMCGIISDRGIQFSSDQK